MQEDELVVRVEEALSRIPDDAFERRPGRPHFIFGDLGSITPRWNGKAARPELVVQTFPSDGLEQTVMPFDALSLMNTAVTLGEAIDWLKEREAIRTNPD